MHSEQRRNHYRPGGWSLSIALILALTVKIFFILGLGPMALERDAAEYWRLGSQAAAGDWWLIENPIAYRTPIYPWLLGIIQSIGGGYSLLTLVALQGLMVLVTFVLAGILAGEISDSPWSRNMVLSFGLLGVAHISFARAALTETLFTLLLTLHLLLVWQYARQPSKSRAMLVGLSLAITILTRPIALGLLFFEWPIWFFHANRKSMKSSHLVVLLLSLILMLVPWIARNAFVFGNPRLTEFLGRNLWIVTFQPQAGAGFSIPDASESTAALELQQRIPELLISSDEKWRLTWEVSNALATSGLNDAEIDRLMHAVCRTAIANDPWTFSRKAIWRMVDFWRAESTYIPYPSGDATSWVMQDEQWTWRWKLGWLEKWIDMRWSNSVLANMLLSGVLATCLLILFTTKSTRTSSLWLVGVLGYFAIVTSALEIPDYRYRTILEPIMITIVAAALGPRMRRQNYEMAKSYAAE
jgi:hypothetical protein